MATRCYCTAVRQLTRRVTAIYDKALAPLGIGAAQFSIMRTLERAGSITATELGQLIDLDRSTVSRNIRVLEREKIVRVEPSDMDHRGMAIALTSKGTRLLAEGACLWNQAQENLRTRIGGATADALLKVLDVF